MFVPFLFSVFCSLIAPYLLIYVDKDPQHVLFC